MYSSLNRYRYRKREREGQTDRLTKRQRQRLLEFGNSIAIGLFRCWTVTGSCSYKNNSPGEASLFLPFAVCLLSYEPPFGSILSLAFCLSPFFKWVVWSKPGTVLKAPILASLPGCVIRPFSRW